jgi:hypothetical protein
LIVSPVEIFSYSPNTSAGYSGQFDPIQQNRKFAIMTNYTSTSAAAQTVTAPAAKQGQRYTKTVFITSTKQAEQFAALRVGQWVHGLSLNGQSGLYRGQFLGFDNVGLPVVNFRMDNTPNRLQWREQFASNKPLRTFARIKGTI